LQIQQGGKPLFDDIEEGWCPHDAQYRHLPPGEKFAPPDCDIAAAFPNHKQGEAGLATPH